MRKIHTENCHRDLHASSDKLRGPQSELVNTKERNEDSRGWAVAVLRTGFLCGRAFFMLVVGSHFFTLTVQSQRARGGGEGRARSGGSGDGCRSGGRLRAVVVEPSETSADCWRPASDARRWIGIGRLFTTCRRSWPRFTSAAEFRTRVRVPTVGKCAMHRICGRV